MEGYEDAEGTDEEVDSYVEADSHGTVPAPTSSAFDQSIANARRRHGAAGAILAAGMLGLDQVLGRKPREEAPIVISTGDQPIDIDDDGILVAIDERTSVHAPPQPRPDPLPPRRRRRRKG
jgi:hypothetical protein